MDWAQGALSNLDPSEVSTLGAELVSKFDWTLPTESEVAGEVQEHLLRDSNVRTWDSVFEGLDYVPETSTVPKDQLFGWLSDVGLVSTAAPTELDVDALQQWTDATAAVQHAHVQTDFPMAQDRPSSIGVAHMLHPQNFDHKLVEAMAVLPFAAHCEVDRVQKWDCGAACERTPVSDIHIVGTSSNGPSATVLLFDGATVAALFRGAVSSTVVSTIADFKFLDAPEYCDGCRVHSGMHGQYLSLRDEVVSTVQKVYSQTAAQRLVVMGWSVGGGLATFAALDLIAAGTPVFSVITLGTLSVGNQAFATYYASTALGQVSWRIVHSVDSVPHVGPRELGWAHVGTEVWYNADNTRFAVCADSECSSSVSAVDSGAHLDYFNLAGEFAGCTDLQQYSSSITRQVGVLSEVMQLFSN